MPPSDPDLLTDVRTLVLEVIGCNGEVTHVEPLQIRRDAAVLLVTITGGRRLVVKLSGPQAEHPVTYERTAMLTALARSTQAPVPEVLAADDSLQHGRWRYLIAERIDGTPWREVEPHLAPDQVDDAHEPAVFNRMLRVARGRTCRDDFRRRARG
jgi:hypothetical protein